MLGSWHAGHQLDREDAAERRLLFLQWDGGGLEGAAGPVSGIRAYGGGVGGECGE
jgi:hypothetical protein